MTNTERLIEELKSLSEIDLQEVMDEIKNHAHREKMNHVLPDRLNEELREELIELESDKENLEDEIKELKSAISDIEDIINKLP